MKPSLRCPIPETPVSTAASVATFGVDMRRIESPDGMNGPAMQARIPVLADSVAAVRTPTPLHAQGRPRSSPYPNR